MRSFLALLKPYLGAFALAVLALVASSFFNAALTALVEPLMDQVLGTGGSEGSKADQLFGFSDKMADIDSWLISHGISLEAMGQKAADGMTPVAWGILVMVVFCGEALFDFIGSFTLGRVGIAVVANLRQDIIDKVMSLSMSFFGNFNTGEVLTRMNADVVRLQSAISVKLAEMVKEFTRSLMFLALAFYLDWKLSLTLFVLVPLVGIPISVFTRKIRRHAMQSQSYLGALTSHFKEVLVGIRVVKGFRGERYESEKLAQENRNFFKHAVRELRIIAMTRPIMGVIGMIVIVAFISYGSIQIQSGAISSGAFILYVLAVYQLYQPIKRLARANSEIQQAVGVMPRIQEIMRWQNEIVEHDEPGRPPHYPEVRGIAFRNVSFTYDKARSDRAVLDNVNFTLSAGTVTALVGASGSGKSTIANLLPRFYDVSEGAILINGLDIREIAKKDLRALFAIVTQDTVLFDDSVHHNIAYAANRSREDVVAAARQAFAHDFIEQLPDGYDTRIGENGCNLSGGQRQRLAIARAILVDAPVLILDEATSALDTESEKWVQMALDNLMMQKTTLVIAHRLSTVRKADTIIVMDAGRISERGNHAELMASGGIYRKLIEMQEEGQDAL